MYGGRTRGGRGKLTERLGTFDGIIWSCTCTGVGVGRVGVGRERADGGGWDAPAADVPAMEEVDASAVVRDAPAVAGVDVVGDVERLFNRPDWVFSLFFDLTFGLLLEAGIMDGIRRRTGGRGRKEGEAKKGATSG